MLNVCRQKSKHGAKDKVRAGSLDLLIDNEQYIPGTAHDDAHMKTTAEGFAEDAPDIKNKFDMVIMNPPYTRNSLRNLHLPKAERELIQQHEIEIAQSAVDSAHRKIIDQTALGSFFIPIADTLIKKDTGTLAMVYPFAFCTAPSQKKRAQFSNRSKAISFGIGDYQPRQPPHIFFRGNANTRMFSCRPPCWLL